MAPGVASRAPPAPNSKNDWQVVGKTGGKQEKSGKDHPVGD